jgi:DNA-binding CsgD family transcriptional regulator
MPVLDRRHEHHLDAITAACAKAPSELALFEDISPRLAELVPFDGGAWFATDPATVLGLSAVRVENIEPGHCDTFWERECMVEDAMLFRDVARSETGVASLYDATGDQPARSARYREYLAPQGYGDNLRAAFRIGASTWGVVDLYRDRSREPFSARERDSVRRVAPAIASALRLLTASGEVSIGPDDVPGTALYDASGTLTSLDEAAERLFTEIGGPDWSRRPLPMTPVYGVVARAAAVAEGRDRGPASARLRSTTGRWISLHASCLRRADGGAGPTALTIEPAKSSQIAPIIIEAYKLTAREQTIVQAVARGLTNQEIAAELFLSTHTVRDHLKAIFAKLDVSTRGELVARLFAEQYAPRLHEEQSVAHVQR